MLKEILEANNPQEISEIYHQKAESFLNEHGWTEDACPKCNRRYFSKVAQQGCGDSSCSGTFEFLTDQRKERIYSSLDLNTAFKDYFEKQGFESYPAKSILNENGTTLFTSAGVQILDDCVLRNTEVPANTLIVSQPSLRTQYIDSIGEGNSLSFVNICTETANATPEDHFANLDRWLGFVSKLGLYAGDITLHKRKLVQKWGTITVQSEIVAVFYKGLEIGDGNYNYGFDPKPINIKTISDFGFGLERLVWILHKGSYFDSVGPLSESLRGNNNIQELTKTLTLLAASGLEPSNRDKGYRFRLFTKKLVKSTFPKYLQLSHLASHYHEYWKRLVHLPVQKEVSATKIQNEYDRNYNQKINLELSINIDSNCSTEDFLLKLLKSGINRDIVTRLIRN